MGRKLVKDVQWEYNDCMIMCTVAKVAAFTMLQYFNLLNHKPIGQVKYPLF